MRWVLSVVAVFFAGCSGGVAVTVSEQELEDYKRQVKDLQNQLRQREDEKEELQKQMTHLQRQINSLEKRKELAQAVIENVTFQENADEMFWEFRGIVKNTGKRYLEDIVVMLVIYDEHGNPIEVPYAPPYKGKELMRKFYYIAGSLDKGKEIEIGGDKAVEKVRLYYKRWHANGQQKVREALKKKRYELKLFYRGR